MGETPGCAQSPRASPQWSTIAEGNGGLEAAGLLVGEGLGELGPWGYYEGGVVRGRLLERATGQQQETRRRRTAKCRHALSRPQNADLFRGQRRGGRLRPERSRALMHVDKGSVI